MKTVNQARTELVEEFATLKSKITIPDLIKSVTTLKSQLRSARAKLGVERQKTRKLQSEKDKLILDQKNIHADLRDINRLARASRSPVNYFG